MSRALLATLLMSMAFSIPLKEMDTNLRSSVRIKEVAVEETGHRSMRNPEMPQKKRFMFQLNGEEIELDLQLNNITGDDTSVHVTENGILKLIDVSKDDKEMYGFYQDPKTNAAVMVKCDKLGSICQLVGTFMLNGQKYRLEPSGERSEVTHFVTEIRRDDGDADMYGDSQQIPELQSSGPRYKNQNKNYSTDDKRGRMKRAIPAGVDIIELYIYTDESIYQRFLALYGNMATALEKIQQYYAVVGNEMDLEYQQVKFANTLGIDIRIYLKGIHVALVASDAPWSSQAVDSSGKFNSSKALNNFSTWQKNYSIANNLQYDHAMAVTAKKFQGTSGGRTWFSALCFSDSYYHASIIEDTCCRLALTAVHELGHFLSANHDPTTGSCSYGYIMASSFYTANATTATIQHTFSSCSINSMTTFLLNLGSNRCTRQHSFTDAEYTAYISQPIGGEVLSLNQQCQVYFGSASFACYTVRSDSGTGADICHRGILCQTSTGCNGTLGQVLAHSPCPEIAYGWCNRGVCTQGVTPSPTTEAPTTTRAPTTSTVTSTISTAAPAPTTTDLIRTTLATTTSTPIPTTTTAALTITTATELGTKTTASTTIATEASTTPTVGHITTTAPPTTSTAVPTTITAAFTKTISALTTTTASTDAVASTTSPPTTTTSAQSTSAIVSTTTTESPTTTRANPTTNIAATTTITADLTTTTTAHTTTNVASTTSTDTPTTTTAARTIATAAPTTATTTVTTATSTITTTTTGHNTTPSAHTTTNVVPTTTTTGSTTAPYTATSASTTATTATPTTTTAIVPSATKGSPTTTTAAPTTPMEVLSTTSVVTTTSTTSSIANTGALTTTTKAPTTMSQADTAATAATTTTAVPTTTRTGLTSTTSAGITTTTAPTETTAAPTTTTAPSTTTTTAASTTTVKSVLTTATQVPQTTTSARTTTTDALTITTVVTTTTVAPTTTIGTHTTTTSTPTTTTAKAHTTTTPEHATNVASTTTTTAPTTTTSSPTTSTTAPTAITSTPSTSTTCKPIKCDINNGVVSGKKCCLMGVPKNCCKITGSSNTCLTEVYDC